MADVQIAVIDQQNTEVAIAVPGIQGPVGQTGDVAVAQDGTAAQPGIRFENDTNTGIYRPGADQVAVATNGVGRLFVDASGRVFVDSLTDNIIGTNTSDGSDNKSVTYGSSNAATSGRGAYLSVYGNEHATLPGDVFLVAGNAANAELRINATSSTGFITHYVNGSERLRITSAGQLSHIGGGSTGSPAVGFNGSAPSNSLIVDSTGKVGIGTSVPDGLLTVRPTSGNAQVFIRTNDTTSTSQLIFGDSADANVGGIQYNHTTDSLQFHVGNIGEKMTLDSLGKLGIGTTSPGALFDLAANNDGATGTTANNTFRFTDLDANTAADQPIGKIEWYSADTSSPGARAVSYILSAAAGANSGGDIRFGVSANAGSASEAARIDSSGRLLVGTSTSTNNASTNDKQAIVLTGGLTGGLSVVSYAGGNSTETCTTINLKRSRSTLDGAMSAHGAITGGWKLGELIFSGTDGTSFSPGASISARTDGSAWTTGDTPGVLVFSTTADGASSPTERMRISSNGNVTIMNSSIDPTGGMLELSGNNGDITDPLSASLTNTLRLTDRDGSSAASQVTGSIQWYTKDATQPGVHSYIAAKSDTLGAGTISIGVRTSGGTVADAITIAPNRQITMLAVYDDTVGATNRDLYIDDTGKLGYVSSIRASKTNIVELSDVNWLYVLEPVSFNRRKQNELEEYIDEAYCETEYGLIAEDVEQVAPELCFYSKVDGVDELRGVHYSKLIAPLLKAVQELKAENESLKARVAVLEAN